MPKRNRHREFKRTRPGSPTPDVRPAPTGVGPTRPPAAVRHLRTADDAERLAARLLDGAPWPIAVISIPSGAAGPFIDADDLKGRIGDLGEVVVMPTNEVSWTFSRAMPAMTQVYGGAGRVYRVDRSWTADPYRSPLRFAFSRSDSPRVVEALARDVAAFALEAGPARAPAPLGGRPRAAGTVRTTVGASRAILVMDDDSYATIWAELTVAGVSIDRLVRPGQRVEGALDPASHRLDIRAALQGASRALAGYEPGMTVLARVESVTKDRATLAVFPGVRADIGHDAITDNPRDDIEDLLTPGEVVATHLASIRDAPVPEVTLRLDIVDDDDDPVPAPGLLDGGPPWLMLAAPDGSGATSAPAPPGDDEAHRPASPVDDAAVPGASPAHPRPAPPPPAARRPAAGAGPTSSMSRAQLAEVDELRHRLRDLESDNADLRRDREKLRTQLRTSGSQRRKAERTAKAPAPDVDLTDLFSDPDEQFRFEVHVEWARRIPAGQKSERPLHDYTLGPSFLESIGSTHGVQRSKVVSVVVEVLTGLAADLDSRELHPLRTDPAGGSPTVQRADGATCMRVALQRNSPGARRMHFWQGEQIELSRVAHHDDMSP